MDVEFRRKTDVFRARVKHGGYLAGLETSQSAANRTHDELHLGVGIGEQAEPPYTLIHLSNCHPAEVIPKLLGYDGVGVALQALCLTVDRPMVKASLQGRAFAVSALPVGTEDEYLHFDTNAIRVTM